MSLYRWTYLPGLLTNLSEFWFDTCSGIRNVVRWTPVIWKDRDFDWSFLAIVMEYKLTRMAAVFDHGDLAGHERAAMRCRVAAILLRRLLNDEYDDAYLCVPESELREYFKKNELRRKADARYLGLLIGKHLRGWWD